MAFASGKKFKSGLDDAKDAGAPASTPEIPTIRPGERMAEFSARVNAALPLSGLKRGGKDPLGLKPTRTRKEKKMHKLYAQWREEERKIHEKKEEELELAAEQELNKDEPGQSTSFSFLDKAEPRQNGKKRGKRRTKGSDDEDPWLEIKRRRAEAKVGLHDVALAPPELHRGNSARRLTIQGAAVEVGSVPKAAGSLRRREQLNEVRNGVVEAYRNFKGKRKP
jgi:hypothetical protein